MSSSAHCSGPRIWRRRRRSTRSSTAASTGTAACTAGGSCCGSRGCSPPCPRPPRFAREPMRMFVADKVAGERAFLDRPGTAGFERPYGWAWLLALHGEAARHDADWAEALAPLAAAFAARFRSASAQAHLCDPRRHALQQQLRAGARARLGGDARPGAGGADRRVRAHMVRRAIAAARRGSRAATNFCRPRSREALLMSRVLPAAEFAAWFDGFLPGIPARRPRDAVHARHRVRPVRRQDRASRRAQPQPRLVLAVARGRASGDRAASPRPRPPRHLAAALPHLADDYMGEHWLASFALLALAPEP